MSAVPRSSLDPGAWLWSAPRDLALFGGSAAASLLLYAFAPELAPSGALPEWSWLACVVAVDVAHVWSTLFRTYFDGEELRRAPLRYTLAPLACWGLGVALYASFGALAFWRALAYLAVFHFVRQQVGWGAVYRAKARARGGGTARGFDLDRVVDDAALYAATLVPLVHWHAALSQKRFSWFVDNDFVDVSATARALWPVAYGFWWLALGAYLLRQIFVAARERRVEIGKNVMVLGTAACWWLGIVENDGDFRFTVTNVLIHGVPYFGLLWTYAEARRAEAPARFGSRIAAAGLGAFLGVLVLLAFGEEWLWDRWVWGDRAWLFGDASPFAGTVLPWLVPLLALPQSTHYALDGFLWRRGDTATRPAQRVAVGLG